MNNKAEFMQNKFVRLKSGVDFRSTDVDLIKYKGPTNELVKDHKDRGVLKASKNYKDKNIDNYAIFLASSKIISVCESIYETKLFPLKFMHMISDDTTGPLAWHRDSYTHKGIQIGVKPAPIKLGFYLSHTNKLSGGTGFLPSNYQRTFDNKYIDYFYMLLHSSKAIYPEFNIGDAGLWDGTVPHYRPKAKNSIHREAVIFSLSRSSEKAKSYFDDPNSLLSRYTETI